LGTDIIEINFLTLIINVILLGALLPDKLLTFWH